LFPGCRWYVAYTYICSARLLMAIGGKPAGET
jgi:hypothetical protein